MNPNIKRILLVSFDGSRLLFLAQADKKIIFFDSINFGEVLPSLTDSPTKILLFRNGEEIDNAIPVSKGENGKVIIELLGFDKIRGDLSITDENWPNHLRENKFTTRLFKEGDILEIRKDWKPFEEKDGWINAISEYREYNGSTFNLLNDLNNSETVRNFIGLDLTPMFFDKYIFASPLCAQDLREYC